MSIFSKSRIAIAIVLALASGAFAAEHKITLTGDQEVPTVKTNATGSGTITVGADKSVSGSITTKGVTGTMAHIHVGAPGTAGPPIITLTKGADGNSWTVPPGAKLSDEQFASYKAGNLYVNVHSSAHKPGEVRGQIK